MTVMAAGKLQIPVQTHIWNSNKSLKNAQSQNA